MKVYMDIDSRGKTIDTKQWIYGFPLKVVDNNTYEIKSFIISNPCLVKTCDCIDNCECSFYGIGYATEVIPESVGRYTGRMDKNKKRIYEGHDVKMTDTTGEGKTMANVRWSEEYSCFELVKYNNIDSLTKYNETDCEVIDDE